MYFYEFIPNTLQSSLRTRNPENRMRGDQERGQRARSKD